MRYHHGIATPLNRVVIAIVLTGAHRVCARPTDDYVTLIIGAHRLQYTENGK